MVIEDTSKAPEPPQSLVRHLAEGRCVLFAGSGLSAAGGLPTWKKLLQLLMESLQNEKLNAPHIMEELNKFLEAGKYLEIADYCRVDLGEHLYNEILGEQLRIANDEISYRMLCNDVQREGAKLSPVLAPGLFC